MATQPIIFNIGEETRPIIEETNKNSIFSDQYEKTFTEINRYLEQVIITGKKDKRFVLKNQNEQVNNIFAFIGERGSGKTSCMLSVANSLVDQGKHEHLTIYSELYKTTFLSIDLIDPSFFDSKNNILAIIVAKLFKTFNDLSKKKGNDEDFEARRKLIEKFEETQRNLKCLIEGKNFSDDDLDQLVSLSSAVDLKKNMFELVAAYLAYMDKQEAVLLVMIDDIDLHTEQAREMAEQIRKYLVQSNVVVLMALKIDQLAMVKRLHFTHEFEKLLQDNRMPFDIVEEMVERYLVKFIPHNQRIFLPDPSLYLEAPLIVNKGIEETEKFASVRQAVPMLIFRKTRFLFYNSKGSTSYIVPRNLRELRQIIKLLFEMKDYVTDEGPEYNKILFKKYLFDTWVMNNLDHDGQEMVKELLAISDAAQINKRVLQMLDNRFESEYSAQSEFDYIIRDANMVYNISVGDVICIIDDIERKRPEQFDQRFLFIIKTIYSIRLYEYYDQLTAAPESEDKKTLLSKEREILKNDVLRGFSNYEKFVAGRFINSRVIELLPTATNEPSRSNRKIDLSALNALIEECLTTKEPISNKLRLAEFFILCISRSYDSQNEKGNKLYYDPTFRERRSQYYAESLASKKKNAFFDINAFFYNITQLEKSYKRFSKGDQLYALANEIEGSGKKSILYQIKHQTINRWRNVDTAVTPENYDEHKWLSWACIRNVEVLQDLMTEMENVNYATGDDLDVLKTFFRKVADFKIETYDKYEGEGKNGYYDINFAFSKIIADILEKTSLSEREWFNQIYKYSDTSELQSKESINADIILSSRMKTGNRVKTVVNKIIETYPQYGSDPKLKALLDQHFPKSVTHISKEEIDEKIKTINKG